MGPHTAAADGAQPAPAREDGFAHLRRIVDNGAMVSTGMEDGMEWVRTHTFPASEVRQAYAHRLLELRRYRQGFTVGAFLGWLADARAEEAVGAGTAAVRCVGNAVRLCDPQSGEHVDVEVESMRPRAAARVLRSVATELRRAPDTRIDIVVQNGRLTLAVGQELRLDLLPRHPCPRTAAHLLRHCLGATASGLRIRAND